MKSNIDATLEKAKGLAPLVIIFCVVLAYANSFAGVFLFDDFKWVVWNPAIRGFTTAVSGVARPVLGASFWLNYALDDLRPAGYHLFNLLAHTGSALLLFGIVRRTLDLLEAYRGRATAPALVVALIWGVHPLTTGSVTYICQRAESLMGFFYLLALYCAIRGYESREWQGENPDPVSGIRHPASGVARRAVWYGLAVLSCAFGMGTKEVMVTAPLAVLLYDWTFRGPGSIRSGLGGRWKLYAGLAGTWLVLAALMLVKRRADTVNVYVWQKIPPVSYVLTQAEVICHYIKLSLWPRPLCLDYRWPVVETVSAALPQVAILSIAALLALWLVARRSPAGFAAAWFFLVLAPTSSFVSRPDTAFEHRMYLPLAAVVVLVVAGVHALVRGRVRPRVPLVLAACVVFGFGYMTHARNRDYRSEVIMWQDVVRKCPWNLRAQNDLAVALSEEGSVEEALAQYVQVLSMIPAEYRRGMESGQIRAEPGVPTYSYEYQYFTAHANMGVLYMAELDRPGEAALRFAAALRVIPFHGDVMKKLRHALGKSGVPRDEIDAAVERAIRAPVRSNDE